MVEFPIRLRLLQVRIFVLLTQKLHPNVRPTYLGLKQDHYHSVKFNVFPSNQCFTKEVTKELISRKQT